MTINVRKGPQEYSWSMPRDSSATRSIAKVMKRRELLDVVRKGPQDLRSLRRPLSATETVAEAMKWRELLDAMHKESQNLRSLRRRLSATETIAEAIKRGEPLDAVREDPQGFLWSLGGRPSATRTVAEVRKNRTVADVFLRIRNIKNPEERQKAYEELKKSLRRSIKPISETY